MPPELLARSLLENLSAYDLFVFEHGYKPGAPELADLFSSMFLHGGFLHLAGNMLFLWIYGDNVEHRLGRLGYLVTYLGSGAAATLAFSLFSGPSLVPLVGASGAISGVLGLYFLFFPRNRVKVFVFLFPLLFNVFLVPARWVLGFYVLVDNLLPFVAGAESGVAYGAHLGGFVAGLAVAFGVERVGWLRRPRLTVKPRQAPASRVDHEFGAQTSVKNALQRDDREGAFRALMEFSGRDYARLSPAESVKLSSWLWEAGQAATAIDVLRRCLAAHSGSGGLARVYLALGLIRQEQGQAAAAYQHLQAVFDYNPGRETADRAREALRKIELYRRRPLH